LKKVSFKVNDNVLVDMAHSDDAGIYKISDQLALVQTTDFFTPIVDDPYLFGQIAAANSLSDIYAMGAKPVSALNIACFPDNTLGTDALAAILQGGTDKIYESGAVIIGGHTVKDNELKYGLAVTGIIDPDRIIRNNKLQKNDKLLLTKPIGTGLLTTALKNEYFHESEIADAIESMLLLNRAPSELLDKYNVHAATDVTGFGLLGHLREMISGSNLGAKIYTDQVPFFESAIPFARDAKYVPGGTLANIKYLEPVLDTGAIPFWYLNLLADPQTSGGLLVGMSEFEVSGFQDDLKEYPYEIKVIGEIDDQDEKIHLL